MQLCDVLCRRNTAAPGVRDGEAVYTQVGREARASMCMYVTAQLGAQKRLYWPASLGFVSTHGRVA